MSTLHSSVYKTDFDLASNNTTLVSAVSSVSAKCETKKRNNVSGGVKNHVHLTRPVLVAPAKKDKEKKAIPATSVVVTKMAAAAPAVPPPAPAPSAVQKKDEKLVVKKEEKLVVKKEVPAKPAATVPSVVRVAKEVTPAAPVKAKPVATTTMAPATLVREVNQTLLPDWVNLSENHQLVDTKSLETNLPSDFANGFDINAPSIQSHIQEMINSDSPLSADMLMESHDLPNYIEVEGTR